jgi:hypothetical protein
LQAWTEAREAKKAARELGAGAALAEGSR